MTICQTFEQGMTKGICCITLKLTYPLAPASMNLHLPSLLNMFNLLN